MQAGMWGIRKLERVNVEGKGARAMQVRKSEILVASLRQGQNTRYNLDSHP